jgi:hypothetical protein
LPKPHIYDYFKIIQDKIRIYPRFNVKDYDISITLTQDSALVFPKRAACACGEYS